MIVAAIASVFSLVPNWMGLVGLECGWLRSVAAPGLSGRVRVCTKLPLALTGNCYAPQRSASFMTCSAHTARCGSAHLTPRCLHERMAVHALRNILESDSESGAISFGSCKKPRHAPDVRDQHPSLGAFDGFLPILRQTAATAEPCEVRSTTHFRQHLEARGVGSLDDLQRPAPEVDKCIAAASVRHSRRRRRRGAVGASRRSLAKLRAHRQDPEFGVWTSHAIRWPQVSVMMWRFRSLDPLAGVV